MRAAPENCGSLRASYRRWSDPQVAASALSARQGRPAEKVTHRPVSVTGEVWIDGDARVRWEDDDSVAVVNGTRWYARSPEQSISSGTDPGELGIERLDEARFPFMFIPELEFDHVSRGEVAERRCWVVHARRRDETRRRWHPLVATGDVWQFSIDADTGVALRIESFWNGRPSTLLEILHIEIDPAFDAALFEV